MNANRNAVVETDPAAVTGKEQRSVLVEAGVLAEAPAIGNYTLRGSTGNFDVSYDNALGANGPVIADAMLARCEPDLAQLRAWFGGVSTGRFTVYIDPGTFGAFHAGCAAREIHCAAFNGTDGALENFLNAAEVAEVLMATQNKGWGCGTSAGEGLSRLLAAELYPASLGRFASASSWLNSTRPDWVTRTEPTDRNYISIGCATLFLNYLHHQLHFTIFQIVQAGGATLQQTYQRLTGLADAFGPFAALLELHFPAGSPVTLTGTDNLFPLLVPARSDLTSASHSPQAVGNPSGYVFDPAGVQVVLYHGTDGHLHDLYWSRGVVGHDDLSTLSHAPWPAGDPFGYVFEPQGVQVALYRGTDGHLHDLYWSTGAVGHDDLSSLSHAPWPAGDPFGYVFDAQGVQVALYRGTDGHLHDLYWSTGAVGHDDLSALSHAPWPGGVPCAFIATTYGVQVVLYRGTDGHLHDLYWSTGAVGHDDLTLLSKAPPPAGDPAGYFIPADGTQHAIYRTQNGHLYELWWGLGPVGANDLTAYAVAPPAAGDPAAYYAGAEGTQHVIYRSGDGHLHELRWTTGAVIHKDLTAIAAAPVADSDPTAWFAARDNTHHVVYRSADGHLHELRWSTLTPF